MQKFMIVFFCCILSLNAFGQEAELKRSKSLPYYLSKVVNSNPEVQASWRDLQIAMYDVDIARSGYRPKIDAVASTGYTNRNSGFERKYGGHTARLALSQLLYDGFFTLSEVKRFKQAQIVRYYELLGEIEQKSLDTTLTYLDVKLFRELLLLAEQNLVTHVSVFKQIEESVEAGVGRRADLEQISGRLSLAESNVLTELSNLHDVRARFLRLVGEKPAKALTEITFDHQFDLAPYELRSTLLYAYENNPAFNAAVYNINSQRYAADSARSRYQPQVNFSASYGTQSRDEVGLDNTITEARVGLDISINLYNGGADRAAIRQALSRVDRAKDVRVKACVDMRQTIQIARNDIVNISHQLPSLNAHRLSSDRVKSAYMDQFIVGNRSLLDLLDSENEYYESSRAYIQAKYTLDKAKARLLASSGILAKEFGIVKQGVADILKTAEEVPRFDPEHVCPSITTAFTDEANILTRDTDQDGVVDLWDSCANSSSEATVDEYGCETPVAEPSAADFTVANAQIIESATININFESNSYQLSANAIALLEPVISRLVNYPDEGVIIHGHASLEGDPAYNQRLSEQRANAVAALLLAQEGITPRQVTAVGYGVSRPLIEATSQAAHVKNRRIEATFIKL